MITGILLAILYVIKQPGSEKSIWLTHSPNMLNSESYWFSEDTEIWNNSLDIESIDPSGEHLVDGPGKKQHNGSKSLYNSESRGRTPTKSTTVQHRPNTMTNHYPVTKAASRQATNHTGTELSNTCNTFKYNTNHHKPNRYRICQVQNRLHVWGTMKDWHIHHMYCTEKIILKTDQLSFHHNLNNDFPGTIFTRAVQIVFVI